MGFITAGTLSLTDTTTNIVVPGNPFTRWNVIVSTPDTGVFIGPGGSLGNGGSGGYELVPNEVYKLNLLYEDANDPLYATTSSSGGAIISYFAQEVV